jgi:hypothetical protein
MKLALVTLLCGGCFDWSQFDALDGAPNGARDLAASPDGGGGNSDGAADFGPDEDAFPPVDLGSRVWQLVTPSPSATSTFVSIRGTTDGTHNIYAAGTQTLVGSVSGGSWMALGPTGTSYGGVAVDNGDLVWATSGGVAEYATDPGLSSGWINMPVNDGAGSYSAIFSTGVSLFVTGQSSVSGRVWVCQGPSCNAGADWAPADPPGLGNGRALWGSSSIDMFVAGLGSGTTGIILHSVSAGSSWTQEQTNTQPFEGLWGGGGRVYAVSADGSLWTRDGSPPTWVQNTSVPILSAALYGVWCSPDGRLVIAVGKATSGHSLILESGDGGLNWNLQTKGGTADILYTVWGDSMNVWAAGTGGAIYRISL